MKNIKSLILFALFGVLSFAQIASGQITQADDTRFSERVAFSPYAQAVPNDSYTFIGISHPSLDTAQTEIGLVVEAIGMTTASDTVAGRASVFTINAGETHRLFIVNESHATLNSTNTTFVDNAQVHLIKTINSAQFGSVRITTVNQDPTTVVGSSSTFANLAQLNIWGAVFVETSNSGFAMEFVGDMQDSSVGGNVSEFAPVSGTTTPGRGIN